jgi:hypothetical protein
MWTSLSRYLAVAVVLLASVSACGKSSPTAPPPAPCTYTLSTSSLSFPSSGGSNSVTVTTTSLCTWTATSDRGWMSITSGSSGSGGGVVNVSVAPNTTTAERSGTLAIAGVSVAVREDGVVPCTIEISPSSASLSSGEATGSFVVSAPGGCEWAATSAVTWLRVTSGSPGSGNGTVSYSVERNRDTSSRTSTIAVGERSFTVMQSGESQPPPPPPPPVACEYSVTPVEFNPCMSVPGNLMATITTQSGCTWTANPNASWITMTGGEAGTGTGVITFRVSDNWDAPRQGIVMVLWPTPTAGQNLHISQAGCRYGVSASSLSFGAAGGTGRFDVLQQSEPLTCGGATQNACRWTAESDVAWITVTTSMPQAGDNPVSFTVAANDGTAARVGTIRVRDKVVQINQGGR